MNDHLDSTAAGRAPGRSHAGQRPFGGPTDVPVRRGAVIFRRAPWEHGTTALIGLGLAMLMQPWSIDIYSYGFTVLLAGVVGYSIAGKLPQG
jgi:hypothetical protein